MGTSTLVYIDDFAGVAASHKEAYEDFKCMQSLLHNLGLEEAKHKACPPSQRMIWLGLEFNTLDMTVSIPQDKMQEILSIVREWLPKKTATRTQLKSILGKLFFITQCCPPARMFLNRMLATMRDCPPVGSTSLNEEFRKDLRWFSAYVSSTNGVFMIHEDQRAPVNIYVDSCNSGGGGICEGQAYTHQYGDQLLEADIHINSLEAANAVAALKLWAPDLTGRLVHLYSDSSTAVAVMQMGRGRDPFLQTCAREAWLTAALHDITLEVRHIPGEELLETADALSRQHLGGQFRERVEHLKSTGIQMVALTKQCLSFSTDL
jgi:hypothetical protein